MSVSLAVRPNRQGNYAFPWLFARPAKEMMLFLGCYTRLPRKWYVSLAVSVARQENSLFPWLLR